MSTDTRDRGGWRCRLCGRWWPASIAGSDCPPGHGGCRNERVDTDIVTTGDTWIDQDNARYAEMRRLLGTH